MAKQTPRRAWLDGQQPPHGGRAGSAALTPGSSVLRSPPARGEDQPYSGPITPGAMQSRKATGAVEPVDAGREGAGGEGGDGGGEPPPSMSTAATDDSH